MNTLDENKAAVKFIVQRFADAGIVSLSLLETLATMPVTMSSENRSRKEVAKLYQQVTTLKASGLIKIIGQKCNEANHGHKTNVWDLSPKGKALFTFTPEAEDLHRRDQSDAEAGQE